MPKDRTICLAVLSLALIGVGRARAGEDALTQLGQDRAALAARVGLAIVAVESRIGENGERYYGTGTVVSADGLVLSSTTAVPLSAHRIHLTWADGTTRPADVVSSNLETETVLLRVHGDKPFSFLPVGTSRALVMGDTFLAAGNPHETLRRDGQAFVSFGTLTGRYVASSDDRTSRYRGELLETDAAVNPGCDGGALVDGQGRLVGLLSLCYTRSRWLGTAVPIDRVLGSLPAEWREPLAGKPAPVTEAGGIAHVLRETSLPVAAAVVRLEFHRAPEAHLASAASTTPRAAAVTQQDADASPMAFRPEMAVTGVLVEPRGWVLTSALNLEGIDGPVSVVLADGRRYRAKPRGQHMDLDVALLKIEGLKGSDALPTVALSATSGLRAGSLIAVTGAPLRRHDEATLVTGVVSALNRFEGLAVQMDAKTNFGNAGGPVTDLQGRFLGIVTQVGPRKCWGQNSGVGFFAPVERILDVLPDLRDGKTLRCPPERSIGVAPSIGENDREGVKLGSIVKNSPAGRAGLREADLITAANGQVIRSWPALVRLLKASRPGEVLRLQVLRGHEVVVVPVKLGEKE